MKALFHSLRYSFYMVQAHLAEMMGDDEAADEMLSIANEFHRLWCREMIQS